MEKILVVCYSYSGSSRRLAQRLCREQGWTLAEIEDFRPRHGALGMLRCVLDSLLRRRPAIDYLGPPPNRFDAVVLVSPIWVHRLAGPMRSFVARFADRLPDLAILSMTGGGGASGAVAEVAALTQRAPLLRAAISRRELDDGRAGPRLKAFAQALLKARDETGEQDRERCAAGTPGTPGTAGTA